MRICWQRSANGHKIAPILDSKSLGVQGMVQPPLVNISSRPNQSTSGGTGPRISAQLQPPIPTPNPNPNSAPCRTHASAIRKQGCLPTSHCKFNHPLKLLPPHQHPEPQQQARQSQRTSPPRRIPPPPRPEPVSSKTPPQNGRLRPKSRGRKAYRDKGGAEARRRRRRGRRV
jgi:hypothetical protein